MVDPNDTALPLTVSIGPNDAFYPAYPGLTKREWFAGMALQGWRSVPDLSNVKSSKVAQWSVEDADALISELSK